MNHAVKVLAYNILLIIIFIIPTVTFAQKRGVYTAVDQLPVYSQGNEAFYKYIFKKTDFGSLYRKNYGKTIFHIVFTITQKGEIVNVEFSKDQSPENTLTTIHLYNQCKIFPASAEEKQMPLHLKKIHREVIKVIRDTPEKFIPGVKNGKNVNTKVALKFNFDFT